MNTFVSRIDSSLVTVDPVLTRSARSAPPPCGVTRHVVERARGLVRLVAASTSTSRLAACLCALQSVSIVNDGAAPTPLPHARVVPALTVAAAVQMPPRNAIPSKDDPALATDDGPVTAVHLAEDVPERLDVPELADERWANDTGDPVGLHNGMVSVRAVDLRLAGRGFDLELARRYASHRASQAGSMGYGWQHSFDVRLTASAASSGSAAGTTFELANGNGRVDVYTRIDATHYAAPAGVYAQLSWDAAASAWVLRTRHGMRTTFQLVPGDAAGTWRAASTCDRHGNTVTFTYANGGRLMSVVDTVGHRLEFFHDANGRLVRVRDVLGREVVYGYDARGDLVNVRTPVITSTGGFADAPLGHVESYAYHSAPTISHRLESIVHATENASGTHEPYVRFEYETSPSSPFVGWVRKQTLGAGTILYAYALENTSVPLGSPTLVRVVTNVADRRGNVTQYRFDETGHARAIREQLEDGSWADTSFDYDADGEVTRVARPSGDWERRTYQGGASPYARGNLVRIERFHGPRAAAQDGLTSAFQWEPVFQHPSSFTDARGAVTRWNADWMEGGGGPASGYVVLGAIALELGVPLAEATALATPFLIGADLNGDGRHAVVRGDLVQRVENAATTTSAAGAPQATVAGSSSPIAVRSATYDAWGRVTSETDPEENVVVHVYGAANDLDGDGAPDADVAPGADASSGGWLVRTIEDVALPLAVPPFVVADAAWASALQQLSNVAPRNLPTDLGRNRSALPPATPTARTVDFQHDRIGRVTARIDGRGVRTEYSIDERDRTYRIVRAADVSAAATRHGGCHPGAIEDLSNQAFALETWILHDPDGRETARFETDTGDEPDQGARAGFHETWTTYDVLGRRTSSAEEFGPNGELAIRAFGYDANDNLETVVDPLGIVVRTTWDARDRVVARTHAFGTPSAVTETVTWDRAGNPLEHVDVVGRRTTYAWDGFDRLIEVVRADASRLELSWDAGSNLVAALDRGVADATSTAIVALRRAEYAYDERSRLVRIDRIDPRQPLADGALSPGDGRVTTLVEHDRLDRETFRIDDEGVASAIVHDGLSRIVCRCDAASNRVETCYDDEGHPTRTTRTDVYPDGHTRAAVTLVAYDSLGRPTARTDALGNVERWVHTSRRGVGEHVDALGNRTYLRHDGRGLLIRSSGEMRVGGSGVGVLDTTNPFVPDARVDVVHTYDANGRRTSSTDDAGHTTRFEYDALGHLAREIAPSGRSITMGRNARGEITFVVDARGNRLVTTRDVASRVTRIERTVTAAGTHGSAVLRYEYDGLGRRTRSIDSVDDVLGNGDDWIVERSFDALGRTTRDVQNGRVVASTWSGEDLRTSLSYPSGLVVTAEHDALHRATVLRQGAIEILRDEYAGPDRRISRRHANALVERGASASFDDSGYADAAFRPTKLEHALNALVVSTFDVAFDADGRRTSERRLHEGDRAERASYDSLGRLVRREYDASFAGGSGGASPARDLETWSLDGTNAWRGHARRGVASTSEVDADGAYTAFAADTDTDSDIARPEHDLDGNLVTVDRNASVPVRLEYDAFDRLRRIVRGTSVVEHDFDAEGRRVRTRTTGIAGEPAAVEYVHDGWNEIEQRDGGGALRLRTIHGGLDQPVRIDVAGVGQLSLLAGPDGSVVAVADAAGNVLERVVYDAYGAPRFRTAAGADVARDRSAYGNPFLFLGLRYEPALVPLVDVRARFYSPHFGRFVQRDPLGAWADSANLGNAYAFVGGDPWNRRDPFGLEGWVPGWLHEGLSWVGFIPGVGVGADLIDGGLYTLEGEWGQAGMAVAAAVPVFGDGFAAGRKVAKAVHVAEELKETKKLTKVGKDVIERLKKIGEHPHDLKKGAGASRSDVFTDREGNLYTGNKDGSGFAERLMITIQELFE